MVVWNQFERGGNAMKRQLRFDFESEKYIIKENDVTIFSIDGKELKFFSVDFYNGVYKDKSVEIELINDIADDPLKKGGYIFNWLIQIVNSIEAELKDSDTETLSSITQAVDFSKRVPLFELSACAGEGFYSEGPSNVEREVDAPYNADYAVTISGKSMEPTIKDKSIVFVQAAKELFDGEIGIFVVNGQVMCKRYRVNEERIWLQPDNSLPEYEAICLEESVECIIQGKVFFVQ